MRMLTAVVKDEQVQNYISENEDSAFEFLKSNFSLETIYNHIVENINYFINDDIEASYEAIKAAARDYTLNIINIPVYEQASVSDTSYVQAVQELTSTGDTTKIVRLAENTSLTALWNKITEINKEFLDSTNGRVGNLLPDNMPKFKDLTNIGQNTNWFDKIMSGISKFGHDVSESWTKVKDASLENPQYAIAILLAGAIGIMTLSIRKVANK